VIVEELDELVDGIFEAEFGFGLRASRQAGSGSGSNAMPRSAVSGAAEGVAVRPDQGCRAVRARAAAEASAVPLEEHDGHCDGEHGDNEGWEAVVLSV
jgi:hypothetical protein